MCMGARQLAPRNSTALHSKASWGLRHFSVTCAVFLDRRGVRRLNTLGPEPKNLSLLLPLLWPVPCALPQWQEEPGCSPPLLMQPAWLWACVSSSCACRQHVRRNIRMTSSHYLLSCKWQREQIGISRQVFPLRRPNGKAGVVHRTVWDVQEW